MKRLTLTINDDYFDKIVSFLELLPKKAVKIEKEDKEKELNHIENELLSAMEDIQKGQVKKIRTIA